MTYLLDTNVLIEAKNRYYAFDLAPGFWEWLDGANGSGAVRSIARVHDELVKGDPKDPLTEWAKANRAFFLEVDDATVVKLQELAAWSTTRSYTQAAIDEFLAVADFHLVGLGAAHDMTVVTHELPSPESKKRILIPDACKALRVDFCNTFDMLRSQGLRLDIGA